MTRRALASAALLLLGGCAAVKPPVREPPIAAVRVTFRSHLSLVRNCESRGVAPTLEAARETGANIALVFATPISAASERANPGHPGDAAAWIPVALKDVGFAGVRAFKCPEAFVEKVAAEMKRPREAEE